ncbi:non-specific lipid-transfer protein 1 [Morus notabilis]|uniref:non-specific lipid-transfer protein 1 n=1 Tax=Morus notabilis TaxID=981085 RepID=UPI000CED480E|nr:non-specific lipid-transfer protein 1 [Morus notabilis]
MACSSFVKIACVVVIAMVVVAAPAAEALTCGLVTKNLTPCVKYIKTGAGKVPTACCSGIRNVNSLAKTKTDRRAVCKCLKDRASAIKSLKSNVVAGLPRKCGVNIPYKISLSINCDTVN